MREVTSPQSAAASPRALTETRENATVPSSDKGINGSLYYVLFQEDASGFHVICFLKNKSETFNYFKIYVTSMLTETGHCSSILRSDNGGEFFYGGYRVSERSNITLMESAMSSLFDMDISRALWAEAANTSVNVNNRVHGRSTNSSPFEIWYCSRSDVSYFLICGSFAYVHVPKSLRRKLDAKSQKLLFVG